MSYFEAQTQDELRTCPYNDSHRIRARRFPTHIIKCQKNYPNANVAVCPYYACHIVQPDELVKHIAICPYRYSLEKALGSKPTTSRMLRRMDRVGSAESEEDTSFESQQDYDGNPEKSDVESLVQSDCESHSSYETRNRMKNNTQTSVRPLAAAPIRGAGRGQALLDKIKERARAPIASATHSTPTVSSPKPKGNFLSDEELEHLIGLGRGRLLIEMCSRKAAQRPAPPRSESTAGNTQLCSSTMTSDEDDDSRRTFTMDDEHWDWT